MIADDAAYHAMLSRDRRFDGVFFVGVTSTGIYCRPICPVKTPQRKNCRFFKSAGAAEKASFRPCLRCRPELAPGNAPVDQAQRIAQQITRRMSESLVDEGSALQEIAQGFGISSRQLRRIVQKELGVSPVELMQTHRLLLAKQLLTETTLPVTEIAFASGFSSLRRFNDSFLTRYRMPPTRLRKEIASPRIDNTFTSSLLLGYRPPYDWDGILRFLKLRTIQDVECVTEDAYLRTIQIGHSIGWVRVTHAATDHSLKVEFPTTLIPALPILLGKIRDFFDLSARPDLVAVHLMSDPFLKGLVTKNPGLRVPGAFDGFEMAARAILGQQITVRAATTLSCRFANTFGRPIETPFPELTRLSPLPGDIAGANLHDIAKLGIIRARSASLLAVARAQDSGLLKLEAGSDPEMTIRQLVALPGIGPWTAHYLAMRTLRWPDAFPKEDIALRKKLGGVTPKQAEELSQPWRPWRSYALLHLWNHPGESPPQI